MSIVSTLAHLETPAALVDLPRLAHNIARMQRRLSGLGVALRPHIKTSKCAQVVAAQIAAGAHGVTVSTLKEAAQCFAENLTQTQLDEVLAVTQQTVQAYEASSRRIPVSALPNLARTLSVSLMGLFGEAQQFRAARSTGGKRGPTPQWQQHTEAIAKLPRCCAAVSSLGLRC